MTIINFIKSAICENNSFVKIFESILGTKSRAKKNVEQWFRRNDKSRIKTMEGMLLKTFVDGINDV